MDKGQISRKQNKEKLQKESHSEIERKRRERMKLETEFLHRQVSHSQCKDKLSIFLAGAERLIHYGNKLGKREYIINDEEYSRIIINTIDGFAIHVRCSDGEIMYEENVQKVLDIPQANFVGKTLYDVAEPSSNTKRIICDNLIFYGSEMQQAKDGELIPRNFVIAMRCGPGVPLRNCVRGSDCQLYRFIEFCGDIVYQKNNVCEANALFRGVCRPLDMACQTVFDNKQLNNQTNPFEEYTSPTETPITSADHVTLRIAADNFSITEVVGNSSSILGWDVDDILNKHIEDFVTIPEQSIVKHALKETSSNGSFKIFINWLDREKTSPVYLKALFTAIQLNNCLYCIVCKLYPSTESTLLSQCKLEPESPISKHSNCSRLEISDSQNILPFDWNNNLCNNYSTANTKPNDFTIESYPSTTNRSVCRSDPLTTDINDNYDTLSNPSVEKHFHPVSTSYEPIQGKDKLSITVANEVYTNSKDSEAHQRPIFSVDTDDAIPEENNDETVDCKYPSTNGATDLVCNNPDGEDWRQLPVNTSFTNMLSEGDLPELFNPDYIEDLIKEDITDL
ncbi:unnamed protein product [Heterobilharzia americana]|nr:unnamed protein product [Heterobilharzia americana]